MQSTRRSPRVVNPERHVPQLIQGPAFANAGCIARQLLGADCEPMGNHAILKLVGHGAATPWHQDEAYWDPRFSHRAVSIWMPLQAATVSNGCMQFIPGSHRGALLAHELIAPLSHGLRLVQQDLPAGAVACEIPAAGGHDPRWPYPDYAGTESHLVSHGGAVFGFRALLKPRIVRARLSVAVAGMVHEFQWRLTCCDSESWDWKCVHRTLPTIDQSIAERGIGAIDGGVRHQRRQNGCGGRDASRRL